MKKLKIKRGFSFISVIVALIWIGFAIVNFTYSLNDILLKEQNKNLEELTVSNAIEAKYTIEKYKQILTAAVAFIETYDDIKSEIIMSELKDIVEYIDFTRLAIDFTDGTAYTSDGNNVDISKFGYADKIKEGEPFALDVIDAVIDGEPTISFVVPIQSKDGSYNAALRGTISTRKFSEMLEETFSKDGGYFYIVDEKGRYVAQSHSLDELFPGEPSYFKSIEKLTFQKGYSVQKVRELFENQEKGMSKYSYGEEDRYCYYEPVHINNWMIMTIVPRDIVENSVTKHIANVAFLMIQIVVIFLFIICYISITQKNAKILLKENQKKLMQLAYYDEFTGIPILAKFKIEAQKFIDENRHKKLLMVKLDIKEFKLVNQILGAQIGNMVIENIGKSLKYVTPEGYELYARLHDDEFLILHTYEMEGDNLNLKSNFKNILYQYMGKEFTYDLKIVSGHYFMTEDACFDVSEAIEKANIAHRRAKQIGQDICIYNKEFTQETLKQKELESRAENALENYEFKVYLQPKYELEYESIIGAEALVRWIDAAGRITFPNDFIPIFEKNGFITTLDFYMFEETCKIIREWLNHGIQPVSVSVNFSRLHLFNPDFSNKLSAIASKFQVPTHLLEIELTETIVMDTEHDLSRFITSLHKHGFLVSMDDFGTGYSSLGLLKNIKVDVIKFDRSFFLDAHENAKAHSILSNMINMAIDLGIKTVAEGVEEEAQVNLLRKLNCDIIQGYYYGRPILAEEFTKKLEKELIFNETTLAPQLKRFNLRKNNELLTDMLDSMPLAFVLWNQDIKIVQCNKEIATFLGFEGEDEFLANMYTSMPKYQPDGQSSFEVMCQRIQLAFEQGYGQYSSWNFCHVNGTLLPCEVTLVRIMNKGKHMVAAYVRDMRLQIEEENLIKQEYEKLKTLMETSPLCFNLWNEQMENTMCNQAAIELFGLDNEQEYCSRFFELSPTYQPDGSRSLDKAKEYIMQTFKEGKVVFEWMHQKLNGEEIWTEITLNRIELRGTLFIAGFTRELQINPQMSGE